MLYNVLLAWSIISTSWSLDYNDHRTYKAHQIWKVEGDATTMMSRFQYLSDHHSLDVLGSDGQVRIKQEQLDHVQKDLLNHGLTYEVIVHDLQEHLQNHDKTHRYRRNAKSNSCTSEECPHMFTDEWMSLEQMEWYLMHINKTYSSILQVQSIGKSIEGRDIWMIHFKVTQQTNATKTVWIEAGIHAREWMSHAFALFLTDTLIKERHSWKNLEFYIVPIANPDGYKFSYVEDRFWRKNRHIHKGSSCIGVDLNRNWDYHMGVGASTKKCAEDYAGVGPFSEPETFALKTAMISVNKSTNLILVLSLHSYGQTLLYPWGWTVSEKAPDTDLMEILGVLFKNECFKINNNKYTVGNSAKKMYLASGATQDWAKGALNVIYSYTLELPDDSHFVIPPSNILKYSQEVWAGCQAIFEYLN